MRGNFESHVKRLTMNLRNAWEIYAVAGNRSAPFFFHSTSALECSVNEDSGVEYVGNT